MRKVNIKPGEFPYRLIDGPKESRYLTWVRNHSNYLAERGFVDYMRIVAILVRGILINFLTVLPYLLVIGLLLALLYNPMLDDWQGQLSADGEASRAFLAKTVGEAEPATDIFTKIGHWVWGVQRTLHTKPPYLLTPLVVGLTLLYYFLFPVVIRLFKVLSARKSIESGHESSVKLRDVYERTFGGALIAILGMALLETLPLLVHYFHQLRAIEGREVLSAVAGGGSVMVLAGAGKLISSLGKAKQKIALVLVALLGLMLPLLVVLYVTESLVYGDPSFEVSGWVLALIPGLLAGGILIAFGLGFRRVSGRELRWMLTLLVPVVIVTAVLFLLAPYIRGRWLFVLAMAAEIYLFCRLAVDVNLTSVLGLYRDRLASAYLVGEDTQGDVDIEEDIDLHDICQYEAFSTAPYHLVNAAHNLQASKDISIRERNSDFFIFSKRFVGGERTGYCRSESLERVFPQIDLATAMAISAAAASPNMGTNTSRAVVALLTLLNIRLGYWIPNPGRLAGYFAAATLKTKDREAGAEALEEWAAAMSTSDATSSETVIARLERMVEAAERTPAERVRLGGLGFTFEEVFEQELEEIHARWENCYPGTEAVRDRPELKRPSPEHGLIGLAFSGGGIRSATLNMGIAQAFDRAGIFDHVDYISTVSGGGYLGSSLSTLMRTKTRLHSDLDGDVTLDASRPGEIGVRVSDGTRTEVYKFRDTVSLSPAVEAEGRVRRGDPLTRQLASRSGLKERFAWRVRPDALCKELISRINETDKWVNLSDGGHIENLAAIELLRRRCRFIVVGDGAADPLVHFKNLATLIRYARIDLGIRIEMDPDEIRLKDPAVRLVRKGEDPLEVSTRSTEPLISRQHFSLGRISYPLPDGGFERQHGYLLYVKSSITGDEDQVIQQYRASSPAFPHESTADQFFNEGQFEAYRSLGQHMAEQALTFAPAEMGESVGSWVARGETVSDRFAEWFEAMEDAIPGRWRGESPLGEDSPV